MSNKEREVLVPVSKLIITLENHGGYKSGKCVVCGQHGWIDKIEHEQDCPVAEPTAVPQRMEKNDA